MTFTYNLASTDAATLLVSKVRLEIGDVSANAGVRPDRSNFTDEEIGIWLAETTNDYHLAAARAYDVLAGVWATQAHATSRPMADNFGTISKRYRELAQALREQYGESGKSFSVGFKKHDGYAIPEEIENDGREYGNDESGYTA